MGHCIATSEWICVIKATASIPHTSERTHAHTHISVKSILAMHVAPLFDGVEILRNLHCRRHILGLIWMLALLNVNGNHHVQCVSQSAISRNAASTQSVSPSMTTATAAAAAAISFASNIVPLSRGECHNGKLSVEWESRVVGFDSFGTNWMNSVKMVTPSLKSILVIFPLLHVPGDSFQIQFPRNLCAVDNFPKTKYS